MPSSLIRSGGLKDYKALGVEGQPVFGAAKQLREAIRIKLSQDAANCFAIPQPNQIGDYFDWYSPFEGDVVPWSAATAEERTDAYSQLELLHREISSCSELMSVEGADRERQIFGRLLKKSVHFPDENHVYLVNRKPVVSFWGFTDHAGTYDHDPLLCLRPPVQPLISQAKEVQPVGALPPLTPVQAVDPGKKKSRWWRWLWLLLLPLLLLLLPFLLRMCAPGMNLPLSLPSTNTPELEVPNIKTPSVEWSDGNSALNSGAGNEGGTPTGGATPSSDTPDSAGNGPPGDNPQPQPEAGAPPSAGEPSTPQEEQTQEGDLPAGDQLAPPELGNESQEAPPQSADQESMTQPMSIPPEALLSGSTDFLNGNWKADTGIQDTKTGKPMQLEYDFQNGKGQVKARRGDGIECVGSVSAEMVAGQLGINSDGQAGCNDGSSYQMPEVACAPDAQSVADCTGSYESQQFPMSMKRGDE